MSDYVKITDYAAKDSLLTGDPAKLVKGAEIGADFDAVAVAVATKLDSTDIGVSVQAYDADLTTWASVTPGTGVTTFLATPSSANLAAAVTDETGSGALVFATSPTLTTPNIGVATATSVNGTTIPTSKTLVVTTDIGTSVQAYNANNAVLNVEQTWTAQQTPMNGTLTDGTTIDWNGDSNGQSVKVTLGGNRTMNAPTNINEYASYVIRVVQDGTGSRTLAWNSAFKFPSATAPTLTTTASAVDVFTFIGGGSNVLYCVGQALNVS